MKKTKYGFDYARSLALQRIKMDFIFFELYAFIISSSTLSFVGLKSKWQKYGFELCPGTSRNGEIWIDLCPDISQNRKIFCPLWYFPTFRTYIVPSPSTVLSRALDSRVTIAVDLYTLHASSSLLPPGLVTSGAASGESVVPKNASTPMSAMAVEDNTKDAWALSLANFGTLEEFLAADAANKEQQKQSVEHTGMKERIDESFVANTAYFSSTYFKNKEMQGFIFTLST